MRGFRRGIERKIDDRLFPCSKKMTAELFGGLAFAQAFQAVAETPLQWRGSVGVESYKIP
jgi:hypothetical protein